MRAVAGPCSVGITKACRIMGSFGFCPSASALPSTYLSWTIWRRSGAWHGKAREMASPRGAPGSPEGIPGMSPCSIVFGARGGSMKEIEALDRCSQVQSQQRPHTSPRCWLVWIQRQGVGEDRGDTGEDPHPILFTCHKFLMDDGEILDYA